MELAGIWKRFPGVIANRDINLRVTAGSIHALIGENGAGKSTLMNTLYGMQRPDEGTIKVNGVEVSFRSPTDAIAAGIGMVHQHFMLADNLTVLENIILGAEPTRAGGWLSTGNARKRLQELMRAYRITLDLDETVEHLGVGERQRVEILKVLFRGARILILDEPTAVLVPQEVDELFGNLRHLVDDGMTIIFISHKLDEVLAICDDITVIRKGTTVATVQPADVDKRKLGELMVGSTLPTPETTESTVTDTVVLSVDSLLVPGATADAANLVENATFTIHKGEILGIAGVEGNGQFELVEAILGLRHQASGTIEVDGVRFERQGVAERRQSGIGYIPFDRHREGLLLEAPLWENIILGHDASARYAKGPFIDAGAARAETDEAIRRFSVATPGNSVPAYALSGGNQQKLIVGREIMAEPALLIAAHPTRGVDVGAQAAIWDELRAARAAGLAVLLISADLDELIGLSDTLVVMCGGEITARLDPADATPELLGIYMAGERQEEVL
ncbi:MAG: ABC transporter ATP-binding protein [Actinobacteria bacterium]|nr:ABC transporter ATP-binding protein [Actinomycetota bacterium]